MEMPETPLCPVHQKPLLFDRTATDMDGEKEEWECWCIYAECGSRLGVGPTRKGAYNHYLSHCPTDSRP